MHLAAALTETGAACPPAAEALVITQSVAPARWNTGTLDTRASKQHCRSWYGPSALLSGDRFALWSGAAQSAPPGAGPPVAAQPPPTGTAPAPTEGHLPHPLTVPHLQAAPEACDLKGSTGEGSLC